MEEKIPLGFGFALAQNPEAMTAFAKLPEGKREVLIQRAHMAASKEEMQSIVDGLVK